MQKVGTSQTDVMAGMEETRGGGDGGARGGGATSPKVNIEGSKHLTARLDVFRSEEMRSQANSLSSLNSGGYSAAADGYAMNQSNYFVYRS